MCRLMSDTVHLPPTAPDAVPREGENLRRARTVFALADGRGRVGCFHGSTMRQDGASVVPNVKTQFGEIAA